MLQPSQDQQLTTARILWAALTFSGILYGFVLFTVGKVSHFSLPGGELQPLEMLAIAANFMAIITFFLHKDRVLTKREFSKRFTGYILCWALNESIAIMGFVAVFVSESGNGFFYLTNIAVAVTANILTFPKK